jgi:hypothetical protein
VRLSAGLCELAFFFVGNGEGTSFVLVFMFAFFMALCLFILQSEPFPLSILHDFPLGLRKPIVIMSLKSPL